MKRRLTLAVVAALLTTAAPAHAAGPAPATVRAQANRIVGAGAHVMLSARPRCHLGFEISTRPGRDVPGTPDPELVNAVALLRRPPAAGDGLPASALPALPGAEAIPDAARAVVLPGGARYLVAPARRIGAPLGLTPRCVRLLHHAIRERLRGMLPAVREATWQEYRRALRFDARSRRREIGRLGAGVYLLAEDAHGQVVSAWSERLATFRRYGMIGSGELDEDHLFYAGLVPDGIATVVLTTVRPRRDGSEMVFLKHRLAVIDNVVSLEIPLPEPLVRATYVAADGSVVWSGHRRPLSSCVMDGPPGHRVMIADGCLAP